MSRKHKQKKRFRFPRRQSNPTDKLLQKVSSSGLWPEIHVQARPPGTEKMSDVILQFAAPLLNETRDDRSYKFAIEFAIIVWNLSFLPSEEQTSQIQLIARNLHGKDIAETKDVITMLLQRKETYFLRHRRMIVEYDISTVGGQRHLTVASTEVQA